MFTSSDIQFNNDQTNQFHAFLSSILHRKFSEFTYNYRRVNYVRTPSPSRHILMSDEIDKILIT
jgi:hypothetical protein